MHDILVLGAGLAGLTAALTAAQAGFCVRVIAKGMGALHWSAGTIDVMGYGPNGEPVERPLSEIERLLPPHPYAYVESERVRESLAWFQSESGAAYAPANAESLPDANLWLPSPAGAKRPAYLAPDAQAPGDLSQETPILVVGLQGMRDFYPDLVAANLIKQEVAARGAHVSVELITQRRDFNTVHLAQALDDTDCIRRLADKLSGLVRSGERIGLPAIVGLNRHSESMAALRGATGADVFEIPTLPPSVPGIRLHRELCDRLRTLGVRVEIGMDIIDYHAEDGKIRWVETETSARPLRQRAASFILATGGVLGGGFTGNEAGQLKEDVFGLPLTAPAKRSEWVRSEFLDPRGQPIFHAGVEVNGSFQPIDDTGHVQFDNLWAAGGLLAHVDPIRERSLEGLAITTGRAAALALLAEAGETTVTTETT